MLIWSGRGLVTIVLAALGLGFGEVMNHTIASGMGLVFAGLLVWFLGKRWNDSEPVLVDPLTGDSFRKRHSLFFIPMQWWGPLIALMGILELVPL